MDSDYDSKTELANARESVQRAFNVTLKGLSLQADKSRVSANPPPHSKICHDTMCIIDKINPDAIASIDEQAAALTKSSCEQRSINNRDVFIIDGAINETEINDFFTLMESLQYSLSESDFDGDPYPIFSAELDHNTCFADYPVTQRIALLIRQCFPEEAHQLSRSYVNLSRYGDMEYPHRDCSTQSRDITALYYGNKLWDPVFGGETKFYEADQGSCTAVVPKPGRIVLFRGSILHMGSVPTRICTQARYTLALKFRSQRIHALI